MPIKSTDVRFVLSGGVGNIDPSQSLGGEHTDTPLLAGLNSLFGSITPQQATTGYTDYRCIYAVNNSTKDTLYSARFAIDKENMHGATCAPGIIRALEVQQLLITTTATSGFLKIRLGSIRFTVQWDSDPTTMATRIQKVMQQQAGLSGVTVKSLSVLPNYIFQVTFAAHRAEPLLQIFKIQLNEKEQHATKRITAGSPINTIAYKLTNSAQVPPNVTWTDTSSSQHLEVGDILPGDVVPFWIRRVIASNAQPLQNDAITLRITGQPNPS